MPTSWRGGRNWQKEPILEFCGLCLPNFFKWQLCYPVYRTIVSIFLETLIHNSLEKKLAECLAFSKSTKGPVPPPDTPLLSDVSREAGGKTVHSQENKLHLSGDGCGRWRSPTLEKLGSGGAWAIVLCRDEPAPLSLSKDGSSGGPVHPRVGIHSYLVILSLWGSGHNLLFARGCLVCSEVEVIPLEVKVLGASCPLTAQSTDSAEVKRRDQKGTQTGGEK